MATTGTPRKNEAEKTRQYTADEQSIIDLVERTKGRKLTQQEINLSLDQARALGEL
jgi:hypothetical protein